MAFLIRTITSKNLPNCTTKVNNYVCDFPLVDGECFRCAEATRLAAQPPAQVYRGGTADFRG